jgi:hypothetical protein
MYASTKYSGAFAKTLMMWKSNKCYIFWACVCSLSYPAYNAHAPHYIVIPVACSIFPHYYISSTIFRKRFLGINLSFVLVY